MKVYCLLALCIHFCIINKARGSFYDPICNSGEGTPMHSKLLPHTHDCSKYIQCSNGIAYTQKCPRNLHWNRKAKICDYPSGVKCQQRIAATAAAQNFKCLSGYYYRHEVSCSKFYYCKYGIKLPLSCVAGFHWNQQLRRCDDPQVAKCPYATDTTFTELIQNGDKYAGCLVNEISWLNSTYLPYPGDCTRFFKCFYGRAWILKCPMGLQWSVQKNRCDYAFYVKCQYNVEKENEINENKGSTESKGASGAGNVRVTKTTSIQITSVVPLNLTSQANTIYNAIPTTETSIEASKTVQQQTTAVETIITEIVEITTEFVKNTNDVIHNSTTIADGNEKSCETCDQTTTENINTTLERTTKLADSTVKEIAFESTSNNNLQSIEMTTETCSDNKNEFITNDDDSTSTTEIIAENTITNLYETKIQSEEVTAKLIERHYGIANDGTNTTAETIGSIKGNASDITAEITPEVTTRNPTESLSQAVEVTTETTDAIIENVVLIVDIIANTAEAIIWSSASVIAEIGDLTTETDSTTNLYESSTQDTTEIIETATEIVYSTNDDIETTTDGSSFHVTTKIVDTTTEIVYATNDVIKTTIDATTENIKKTKGVINSTIAVITTIMHTNTTTEVNIETTTEIVSDYIVNSANDDTNNAKETKFGNAYSDIAKIIAMSKNNEKNNHIVEATIASVQSIGPAGNAVIQTNASTTQSTTPATKTIQPLTTQDPRLPFRAPQCSGINNRIKFVALNCYQFYQCFEGYAYLLNCYDGYAFSLAQSKCIQANDTICNENLLK